MIDFESDEKKTFWKKVWEFISEDCWWRIQDFWKNYIWPAYHIKNFFFNRYDLVKMPQIKRCEYSDVVERVLWANVELLKFFIEKERPEEFVEWYGEYGHKYVPETMGSKSLLFPEFEGEYTMDLMKKSYNWFTKERIEMVKEEEYLLDIWYKFLTGRYYSVGPDDKGFYTLKNDESTVPTDLAFFDDKDLKWDILDKYLEGDRANLIKKDFIFHKHTDLENEINQLDQKYLHLIIECRFSMWT